MVPCGGRKLTRWAEAPRILSRYFQSMVTGRSTGFLMTQTFNRLRHELSAGQMAMVAVGGSIGTGLLLGSGAAIQIAGPSIIISYIVGGLIAFAVTMALGGM